MADAVSQVSPQTDTQSAPERLDGPTDCIFNAMNYQSLAVNNTRHPDAVGWLKSARGWLDEAIEVLEGEE